MTGDACADYITESTTTTSIHGETTELKIDVVPPGTILTRDFNQKRVRIFVDENNIVNTIPGKG
jgi:hypothetical protein